MYMNLVFAPGDVPKKFGGDGVKEEEEELEDDSQ